MEITFAPLYSAQQLSEITLAAAAELKERDFNDEGWERFVGVNTPEAFRKRLTDTTFSIFCCMESDRALGFISIKDNEKIDQLFVLPELQKRGIATQLWHIAREKTIQQGGTGNFWVRSSSIAVPVYQRFGFVAEGERDTFNGISFQLMRLNKSHG
jgi:GNAT superfamily N-acetyltransferase